MGGEEAAPPGFPPGWLSATFPDLALIRDNAWIRAISATPLTRCQPGEQLFQEGEPCDGLILVTEGLLRMQRFSSDGHEITLYHLSPGDICPLSAIRLLRQETQQTAAITETASTVATVPGQLFRQAFSASGQLRAYLLRVIDKGQDALLTLIEDVAFGDMNQRLVGHLLAHPEDSIQTTHQELAGELGTAREVVSRLLKGLERRGCLCLHRGHIELLDRPALERCLATGQEVPRETTE